MEKQFFEPATFDSKSRTFHGTKHKYRILESLPVCRFIELGIVESEISYGAGLETISSFCLSVYNNVNNGTNRAADAVNAYKLMESIKDITGRKPALFKLIDLYTVREGQELTKFGGEHLKDKIADWENIDTNFFFQLAQRLIPNYLNVLKQLSQSM